MHYFFAAFAHISLKVPAQKLIPKYLFYVKYVGNILNTFTHYKLLC